MPFLCVCVCASLRVYISVCSNRGGMRCGVEPELQLRGFLIDFTGRGAGGGAHAEYGGA